MVPVLFPRRAGRSGGQEPQAPKLVALGARFRGQEGKESFLSMMMNYWRGVRPNERPLSAHLLVENAPTQTRAPSRASGFVLRRISPVGAHSGDRLLSEPMAGTQPCRREPLFMPHCGHCLEPVAGFLGRKPAIAPPAIRINQIRAVPVGELGSGPPRDVFLA